MPSALEQLLLPAECLLCHGLLSFDHAEAVVCPPCRTRWRSVRPPWCDRCGQPGPHFGPCRLCREWPRALGRVRSAVWLDDTGREAVHALKYAGLPRIAVDLADAMVRRLVPPPEHAVLVPIPLAPRRLRQRGYNQSAMLAQALGRGWGRPVRDDLLARARETATQTALTPAARLANVAGAFETGNAEVGTRNELVLVDDVFTTGATLAEAARALETAGAEAGSVTAVTFGRALIPDFT